MKYSVDPSKSQSAYLQVYHQLRADIVKGLFPFGSKLPSKRMLAEEMGISIITVEHAYALLSEEGYVEPRERSGFYVTYREKDLFSAPKEKMFALSRREESSSEREGFSFSVFSKAVRRVLAEYGDRVLIKSENAGHRDLRLVLSRYLERNRGICASPEQIVIGSGAEYLYGLLVQMLGRDCLFALEDPSYEKIRQVYEAEGAKTVLLPLTEEGIESGALWQCEAKALHITPFRSYPSGVSATASKKREYLRWAEERCSLLIEDDFQSEFTLSRKPEETLFAMAQSERVIYINTFSQTVSPGIRVGYMVLPPGLLPLFREKVGFFSCTVPVLEQLVLASLISSGEFERHINRVRRKKRKSL